MKFFTKKEVFHQQNFFLDQGSFPQSKKVSANKNQIGSLKPKISTHAILNLTQKYFQLLNACC